MCWQDTTSTMPRLTTLVDPDNMETQAWDMDFGLFDGPVHFVEASSHYMVDPVRVSWVSI